MAMKIVAIVPARGTNTEIPNKNMRIFCGEPLFVYTLRKLLNCKLIDEVYLDSEDDKILDIGRSIGVTALKRDSKLSASNVDGNAILYAAAEKINADIYVQVLCTNPFIKIETIETGIELLKESNNFDSFFLAKKDYSYSWENVTPKYNISNIPNSTDLPYTISESMGIYIIKRKALQKTKRRIGDKPKIHFGSPAEFIRINNMDDLNFARTIAAGMQNEESKYFRLLKTVLSSPIISDVCDDMNLQCVLTSDYSSNIRGIKVLGRARTLKIRKARVDDQENAIYDALKSYDVVIENDVIVVGTERPDLAYFGELNMSLAIRAGASGAIISGVTRDSSRTLAAQFPVFSKGRYCKDIKGQGAVEGINIPMVIDGINVNFGDLIFGDDEGIVIIPRKHEKEIIEHCLDKINQESRIIKDILLKKDTDSLISKHGNF